MCMEDIRLGRRTATSYKTVTVTTNSQQVLDYSKLRTNLTIYPPASGTLTVAPGSSVSNGVGITLNSGSHPLQITLDTHGDLVNRAFSIIHSAGGVSIFICEGLLEAV